MRAPDIRPPLTYIITTCDQFFQPVKPLLPSKHDILAQCWFTDGTPSTTLPNSKPTLGQRLKFSGLERHWPNAGILLGQRR